MNTCQREWVESQYIADVPEHLQSDWFKEDMENALCGFHYAGMITHTYETVVASLGRRRKAMQLLLAAELPDEDKKEILKEGIKILKQDCNGWEENVPMFWYNVAVVAQLIDPNMTHVSLTEGRLGGGAEINTDWSIVIDDETELP